MPATAIRSTYLNTAARIGALAETFIRLPEIRDRFDVSREFPCVVACVHFGFIELNALAKGMLTDEYTNDVMIASTQ